MKFASLVAMVLSWSIILCEVNGLLTQGVLWRPEFCFETICKKLCLSIDIQYYMAYSMRID